MLDRIRADVTREAIETRPYRRRHCPKSDRYSTASAPMSSEKRSVLGRIRAHVIREVIDIAPVDMYGSCVRGDFSLKYMIHAFAATSDRIHADCVVRETIGVRP